MDSQPIISRGLIVENRSLSADSYLMSVDCPELAGRAGPGQFVKVRTWAEAAEGGAPLLDRPFSIHQSDGRHFQLLYRVLGPATRLMSSAAPGRAIKVSGPLGRGLADVLPAPQDMYLVGGGIGLAPMALVLGWLGPERAATLFYGERSGAAQVEEKWLRSWAAELICTVEDGGGYGGRKGRVTGPLEEALAQVPRPVFACGPLPMLAAVSELCARYQAKAWVSLEALMACGFGVCLTCSLPLKNGGRFRVCREGPVLDGSTVDWGRLCS